MLLTQAVSQLGQASSLSIQPVLLHVTTLDTVLKM